MAIDPTIVFLGNENSTEIPEKIQTYFLRKNVRLTYKITEDPEEFLFILEKENPILAFICALGEFPEKIISGKIRIPVVRIGNKNVLNEIQGNGNHLWVKQVNPANLEEVYFLISAILFAKGSNVNQRGNPDYDFLNKIFNSAQELIVVTQGDHLMFFNSRVKEFYDLNDEYLLSGSFWDFIHPEDREIVREQREKRLTGSFDNLTYQFRGRNVKGEIIWFRNTGIKIDWEGDPATLNFLVPIDEQKRAEETALKTRKFLDDVIEYSPEGIVVLSADLLFCRVNKSFINLTGLNEDELKTKNIGEISILEESGLIEKLHLRDRSDHYNGISEEFSIVFKDGQSRDLRVSRTNHSIDRTIILWFSDITAKNNILKTMLISEKKYRELHENMHEGTISIDKDGRFLECNTSFLRLVGYAIEDLRNRSYWDITSSYWKPSEERILFKELWITGKTQKYEKEFIRLDRRFVITEVHAYIRRNENGENEGFWLFVRDISDEKEKEREIIERGLKYQTILEYSPTPLFSQSFSVVRDYLRQLDEMGVTNIKDYLGKHPESISHMIREVITLDCNQAALEFFGVQDIGELRTLLSQNIPGELPAVFKDLVIRFREGENVFERELVSLTKNNLKKNAIVKWVVVPGHEVSWDMILVSIVDISDRIKYEKQLKVLSSAIDHSPVSVVITDPDGNIEYVNPKFTEVTGYSAEEAFGENPRILKSGNLPDSLYKDLWETIKQGKEWRGEFENKKKNGEIFWELASISGIKNEKGAIVYYVAIKEDITERKKTELELLKAKDKAEESDRLKTAFLANMSHEIRTPLNAIIGFSDILRSDVLDKKQKEEYFTIINFSSKTLLNLIDDIIDVAKIEAGHTRIVPHNFNLTEIMDELSVSFKREIELNGYPVQLLLSVPLHDKFNIVADATRVKQVLSNLLGNAVKFTKKGTIGFGYSFTEEKMLEFFVKDTGIGIPEDQQKVIFKRFRQVDDTSTRKFGGTGLGLWISKNLVELMGGRIWVFSEPGRGADFRFTFPLTKEIVIPEEAIRQPAENTITPKDWKKKKILVAEDNDSNFEYIRAVLSVKKVSIIHAKDGREVLDVLNNRRDIDLVLMDIQMPGLNGYETTRMIKKMYPGLPVIAQTAYAMSEDRQKVMEAGCDEYIAKPIQPRKLIGLLEKFLNNQHL